MARTSRTASGDLIAAKRDAEVPNDIIGHNGNSKECMVQSNSIRSNENKRHRAHKTSDKHPLTSGSHNTSDNSSRTVVEDDEHPALIYLKAWRAAQTQQGSFIYPRPVFENVCSGHDLMQNLKEFVVMMWRFEAELADEHKREIRAAFARMKEEAELISHVECLLGKNVLDPIEISAAVSKCRGCNINHTVVDDLEAKLITIEAEKSFLYDLSQADKFGDIETITITLSRLLKQKRGNDFVYDPLVIFLKDLETKAKADKEKYSTLKIPHRLKMELQRNCDVKKLQHRLNRSLFNRDTDGQDNDDLPQYRPSSSSTMKQSSSHAAAYNDAHDAVSIEAANRKTDKGVKFGMSYVQPSVEQGNVNFDDISFDDLDDFLPNQSMQSVEGSKYVGYIDPNGYFFEYKLPAEARELGKIKSVDNVDDVFQTSKPFTSLNNGRRPSSLPIARHLKERSAVKQVNALPSGKCFLCGIW